MPTPDQYPDVRPQSYKRDVVDSGNPHADMRVDTSTGEALGVDIETGKLVNRRAYERSIAPIARDPADLATAKTTGIEPLAGARSGDAKPADQSFDDNGFTGPDVGGADGSGGNGNDADPEPDPDPGP